MSHVLNFDCVIVGARPAGLQAAYDLKKKGLSVVVLERGRVGQFFRQFPRHRMLISINKMHTGLKNPETKLRYDWNSLLNDECLLFTDVSRRYFPNADDYVGYLSAFAELLKGDIRERTAVQDIARDGAGYSVSTADGTVYKAQAVIVATGVSLPFDAGIDGQELIENYVDFDPTPARFRDKRVAILGKGNSAFETTEALIEEAQAIHVISPNKIKFAWNTHFVGNLQAVNNNFLDTYQLKSQNAVIDGQVTKIEKHGTGFRVHVAMVAAEGHTMVLDYDHVIACTGFLFDASILSPDLHPEMRHMGKFPAMSATWEHETAPGLFFAGTIMQCRDFKKTMSGFVHGFRHNVACLTEFVARHIMGDAYPHGMTALEPEALAETLISRVSTGSGIFLQPSFLGDVVVLDGPKAGAHYRDVPMAWAAEAAEFQGCTVLRATMEFGDFGADPMHLKRAHLVDGEAADPFIHPVLRLVRNGKVVAQTHLSDILDSDCRAPEQKPEGLGTVQRMTYKDAGAMLSGYEVAHRQIAEFFALMGILANEKPLDSSAVKIVINAKDPRVSSGLFYSRSRNQRDLKSDPRMPRTIFLPVVPPSSFGTACPKASPRLSGWPLEVRRVVVVRRGMGS